MSRFRCVRSCCRRWMLSLKEFSVRSAGEASRSSQLQIKIGPKKKNFSFFLGNIDYTWKSVWPTIFGARAHWVLGCVSLALRVTSLIVVTTWTRGLFQGSKCESKIFINFFPDKFSFFFLFWNFESVFLKAETSRRRPCWVYLGVPSQPLRVYWGSTA